MEVRSMDCAQKTTNELTFKYITKKHKRHKHREHKSIWVKIKK